MADNKFRLVILIPYGIYFDGLVSFLEVHSEKYNLGILPNHAPLISTVEICKGVIRMDRSECVYAIGGGVINVKGNNVVNLIVNSIERSDEINVERAKESLKRAQERLDRSAKDEAIDVSRAKAALLRASNRIKISSKE